LEWRFARTEADDLRHIGARLACGNERSTAAGDHGRRTRPRAPRWGELTREALAAGQCEGKDPLPSGVRGNFRGTAIRESGEERLDDRRVDAIELLLLERSYRRGDIDGRSQGGFLRRCLAASSSLTEVTA